MFAAFSRARNAYRLYQEAVAQLATLSTEQMLNDAMRHVSPAPQFTEAQLRTLLQLCHPDKHGGKESAVLITQHINQLRE